jgi:hypothetical protein
MTFSVPSTSPLSLIPKIKYNDNMEYFDIHYFYKKADFKKVHNEFIRYFIIKKGK